MNVVQIGSVAEQQVLRPPSHVPGPSQGDLVTAQSSQSGSHRAARKEPAAEPYAFDRAFHAMLARFTGGVSPVALSLA
ncbi:poly-beta-hydroxybutyrate polymerase N-terminal domain-containing protein, partial [Acinetobacter baumannii]